MTVEVCDKKCSETSICIKTVGNKLSKIRLVLLILTCSFGFFSSGTFIGWTSNITQINQYSPLEIGDISAVLALGAIIGSILSLKCFKHVGMKAVFMCTGILLNVSWIIIWIRNDWNFYNMIISRFITGISIGVIHFLIPLYLSEFASIAKRHFFEYILYISFVIGLLLEYIAGFYFSIQYSMCALLGSAILFFVGTTVLPESPQYISLKGNYTESFKIKETYGTQVNLFGTIYGDHMEEISKRNILSTIRDFFKPNISTYTIPFLIFAGLLQSIGGYSLFFFMCKIFIHIESDYQPEIISITSCTILLATIPMCCRCFPNIKDKVVLTWTIFFLSISLLYLGFYIHQQGVTGEPTKHGYRPLLCFCLYSFFYGLGPFRLIIHYIQALSNEVNGFVVRLLYTIITWGTIAIVTKLLPLLIDFIGIGWVFWYMGFVSFLTFLFVATYIPDLQSSVIESKILINAIDSNDNTSQSS